MAKDDSTPKKHLGAKNELTACIWLLNQGYDVFRNISQHGLCDIIAWKSGELILFDVKALRTDTAGIKQHLSDDQRSLGIKCLGIKPDGTCQIMEEFIPQPKSCKECGSDFVVRRNSINQPKIFCSKRCKLISWKRQKALYA